MVVFKICLFSLFFFSFVLGACTIKANNLKDTEGWSLVLYRVWEDDRKAIAK